jgi:hypothetical protein
MWHGQPGRFKRVDPGRNRQPPLWSRRLPNRQEDPMSRNAARLVATLACAALLSQAALPAVGAPQGPARAGPPQPPHAWLFGSWTGGIFPAPSVLSAEACLSQPVVIFTRDVLMRALLTSEFYVQRVIETARETPDGAEFRFASAPPIAAGPLGLDAPAPTPGFGCESPDVLHVQRHTQNEIAFPGCADFPYPLVRCPGR